MKAAVRKPRRIRQCINIMREMMTQARDGYMCSVWALAHACRGCGDVAMVIVRPWSPFRQAQSTDSVRFLGIFCALSGCTRRIISLHRNLRLGRKVRVISRLRMSSLAVSTQV